MTIYVVPIEPIDTRYTRQWYTHIPALLDAAGASEVVIIQGDDVPAQPTPGAFLDFGATNIYKGSQLSIIAQLFRDGAIKDGDKFLYTDAWNPTVIQLRYMAELLGKKIEIHGMWHAGSYDPQDFLGRLVGDKPWVRNAESSMFYCYDVNWFATKFHALLFLSGVFNEHDVQEWDYYHHTQTGKIELTGWPMDYLYETLEPYSKLDKKPQIVFPHRLAPEKQLEIFQDLAASMPQYEWVVCQTAPLTKDQYHTILGESAMIFSANLQETYGISAIEGLICGAMPMLPDRLSYSEMYDDEFKYPSFWTKDWDNYTRNKDRMIAHIDANMQKILNKDNALLAAMQAQVAKLRDYTYADPLIKSLVQ
jgi:hypothetical protein